MEFVCGIPLGILAGDLTEEPLPDPVFFIPRVEGQRDLLEQAGFRWNSTTDGFIKHIKIRFIHDFVCFLNPAPAQITNFNGDGSNLQGIIKAPEIDFLAGWLIGHFKGAFLDLPICLNPKPVDCPFQFSKTGIFQGSEHLTNNKGVGFRVFHHSLDDVQGRGFGFLGSTGTLAHPVTAFEVPEGGVTFAHHFRKADHLCLGVNLQADHPPRSPREHTHPASIYH